MHTPLELVIAECFSKLPKEYATPLARLESFADYIRFHQEFLKGSADLAPTPQLTTTPSHHSQFATPSSPLPSRVDTRPGSRRELVPTQKNAPLSLRIGALNADHTNRTQVVKTSELLDQWISNWILTHHLDIVTISEYSNKTDSLAKLLPNYQLIVQKLQTGDTSQTSNAYDKVVIVYNSDKLQLDPEAVVDKFCELKCREISSGESFTFVACHLPHKKAKEESRAALTELVHRSKGTWIVAGDLNWKARDIEWGSNKAFDGDHIDNIIVSPDCKLRHIPFSHIPFCVNVEFPAPQNNFETPKKEKSSTTSNSAPPSRRIPGPPTRRPEETPTKLVRSASALLPKVDTKHDLK